MRILLVEDDEGIAKTLENILGKQHYIVDIAINGQVGWELTEAFAYDLILLDVLLPKLDGIEFCQRLRSRGDLTPVLLLTAQSSSQQKVKGLNAGADDYVVKPFEISELLARIRVLLRRRDSLAPSVLEWENLRLDSSICQVTYQGEILHFTPKEYRLLELFLRTPRHILSRSAILEHLWSTEEAPSEDTVTAHIKGLRQKLKQAGVPKDLIETVYGLGYRLKSPLSLAQKQSQASSEQFLLRQQTQDALAEVWEKFKGLSDDRLAILEQAILKLQDSTIDNDLLQQAKQAAHKLAGALGVFGLAEGSHLAQQIEQLLKEEGNFEVNQSRVHHLSKLVASLRHLLVNASSGSLFKPMLRSGYPVIFVVDDARLTERIVREAATLDMRIALANNVLAVREALANNEGNADQPALAGIVLKFSLTRATEESLKDLAEFINQTPPMPVIFFPVRDRLSDRLKATQLDTHIFLSKPEFSHRLLKPLMKILRQVRETAGKVMVVDDDPKILAVFRALLEPWGIQLATLDNPLDFWELFLEFSPNLLILDLEMPNLSGIKLCQVVRNDARWSSLPILFFTVHTDANTVHQVLTAGANDHISKSLVEPELVNRIFRHLERGQLLRSLGNLANV